MGSQKFVIAGGVQIGGGAPIRVQSMLNTPADDTEACVRQAKALADAGCELIRTTVPDMGAVKTVAALKEAISVPVVADIHFDYKMAIEAAYAGADKIRLNPGNIGDDSRVKKVADVCRERGLPIRIGVNSGSVEKDILKKYGAPTPEALVESALYHVRLLQRHDFDDIVLSLKSSDVPTTVQAYRLMKATCDYPLHVGVTEAGTRRMGLIKSAAGIGALLLDGIGDTIRVSLTAPPVEEVYAGHDLLKAIGVRKGGVNLVSCPTCGRTKIDLIGLASRVEEALRNCEKDITVAVMGCAVNGPGEASHADIGIAGGNGTGLLFKKGEILYKVPEDELFDALMREIALL
ncbi:MAG: flavodoxin-dependent (E)-4-hydroxy-3-methylbut-2-enyl-diphosphate synthase [Clostridia bacterium]|nr:flavodoxin-dependent (E)-4-hydroxy-3-methylbut-2-enyl-diphosphate synthase [Clostridia bacterium]MBR0509581.1 flavodoxin-dependent (E)-4-hydroxy-3-methylbut-2-enyl-diphosphate synthase [Clostridia bacterium]MBR0537794.1 flavodoxin-dependent (E)-4-hydroxy-3-methylbut-2-enyl-diphosphate synthase [Clostridia bacterium]